MSLTSPSPTALRFCTISSFIEHVATLKDTIYERIWDPEVTRQVALPLSGLPFGPKSMVLWTLSDWNCLCFIY